MNSSSAVGAQVLGASLDARVFASDSSALARDCRRDIKAASAKLLKLGRKVPLRSPQALIAMPRRSVVRAHITGCSFMPAVGLTLRVLTGGT